MIFNKISANGKESFVIQELEKEIAIVRDGSEYCLELKKSLDKGYRISRDGDRMILEYFGYPEMCRGLLKLTAMEKIDTDCHSVRCFDDYGVMIDTSRNAVPRIETVEKLIRIAALLGYGFVGLYMEDTLQIRNEPYWGYQRGAYSEAEIKRLDSYALKMGIELRPFIQTLAHINQVVRYERYEKAIDTADIFLIGEERTEEIIENILSTVSAVFTSRKVNIGMDEAFLVGRGKYIDKHGYKTRRELMNSHLDMVLKKCSKYGLQPQMWSDMFFDFVAPEDIVEKETSFTVPKDLEICYWDYYSLEEKHYEDRLKAHFNLTDKVGFAGGAWKWSGMAPHNRFSINANKAAVAACQKYGVNSYTVTGWGDNGAEASCFSILPVLFAVSNMIYADDVDSSAFEKFTGESIDRFLSIDDVNPYMDDGRCHNNSSKYLLFNDVLEGTFDSVVRKDYKERIIAAKTRLLECANNKDFKYNYIFKSLSELLGVLEIKGTLGIELRSAYESGNKDALKVISEEKIPGLLERLDTFYEEFKNQWDIENKPNGFEVQTIRIGGLILRIKDIRRLLNLYLAGEIESIELLDEKQLDFAYFDGTDISSLNYNLWSNSVSAGVIG